MSIPHRPLSERALDWADAQLDSLSHAEISLRAVASGTSATHPAIMKQFGSHMGFLAALAERQWDLATDALNRGSQAPLDVALADIAYAIDHPYRFRLMYAHELWNASSSQQPNLREREKRALSGMRTARDLHYYRFAKALGGSAGQHRVRLVAALMTGLSFEFVNERLFDGDHEKQLAHAKELLLMVMPPQAESGRNR